MQNECLWRKITSWWAFDFKAEQKIQPLAFFLALSLDKYFILQGAQSLSIIINSNDKAQRWLDSYYFTFYFIVDF